MYNRNNYRGGRSRGNGGGARGRGNGHGGGRGGYRAPRTANFDKSLLVKKATGDQVDSYAPKNSFDSFAISDQLKQNIKLKGYVKPTAVQDQAIPHILAGRDVVGVANTGTGKTAAFLVPLLNKISGDRKEKILIITPTRELASQIRDEAAAFSNGMGVSCILCIGGASMGYQIEGLRRNPDMVVGTPGRLKDLEQRRRINFGSYRNIVLDEVDRMLDMGFIHDIKHIVAHLPQDRQSLFFSATLSGNVNMVMRDFLRNPAMVSVKTGDTAANVDQDIVRVNGKEKFEVLHELLLQVEMEKVLVFGRTKWGVEKLSKRLAERGHRVAALHGNKNQNQRLRALNEFKQSRIKVLLATDVASRGLDIDNVTHVINYDLPQTYEDYVHRIGRTGRADKKGMALSFVD